MTTADIKSFRVNNEEIEVVDKFVYLGSMIEKNGDCGIEIRRRTTLGKVAMIGLDKIWKSRDISKSMKTKLIKTMIFPVALYGSETWTMHKKDRGQINVFEF